MVGSRGDYVPSRPLPIFIFPEGAFGENRERPTIAALDVVYALLVYPAFKEKILLMFSKHINKFF